MAWLDIEAEIAAEFAELTGGERSLGEFAGFFAEPGAFAIRAEHAGPRTRDRFEQRARLARDRLARAAARAVDLAERPTCPGCGGAPRATRYGPVARYCSRECQARTNSARSNGERNAHVALERAVRVGAPCESCGAPSAQPKGRVGPVPRFCSSVCRNRAWKRARRAVVVTVSG